MPSSLLPAIMSVAVLVELATGCASGNPGAREPQAPTLSAEEIERNPNQPIEKLLQDKAPGLIVRRGEDGNIAVTIRGSHSFTGTDAPLYVLDGMPFEPGPEGLLSGVDPYNIASIRVLKGSEAALYGIRGMNGVIEISTKKPDKRVR